MTDLSRRRFFLARSLRHGQIPFVPFCQSRTHSLTLRKQRFLMDTTKLQVSYYRPPFDVGGEKVLHSDSAFAAASHEESALTSTRKVAGTRYPVVCRRIRSSQNEFTCQNVAMEFPYVYL